ncbi:YHS domain-containing protein [Candidatus Micrarchaeota archaeon]|nr:YHS domain-containing protein [Candidatus Micrarchaeota archaeon]
MEIDPNCKMEVDPKTAKYKTAKNKKTYYFCSKNCFEAFMKK